MIVPPTGTAESHELEIWQVELSPLCMCAVIVKDEVGEIVDEMICFGDDQGMLHLYNTAKINANAERNM